MIRFGHQPQSKTYNKAKSIGGRTPTSRTHPDRGLLPPIGHRQPAGQIQLVKRKSQFAEKSPSNRGIGEEDLPKRGSVFEEGKGVRKSQYGGFTGKLGED